MKSLHSTQREETYVKFSRCSFFENYVPILKVEKVRSYCTPVKHTILQHPNQLSTVLIYMYSWWDYSYLVTCLSTGVHMTYIEQSGMCVSQEGKVEQLPVNSFDKQVARNSKLVRLCGEETEKCKMGFLS